MRWLASPINKAYGLVGFALAGMVAAVLCVHASPAASAEALREEVESFIGEMTQRHGFESAWLRRLLAQAKTQPGVIEAMSTPATARPWHEYFPNYVNAQRIQAGVRFWRDNQVTLAKARAKYGVPEEIIVATLGVETNYGTQTGSRRVLDVLTTLAFDFPPRAGYFKEELEQFLVLAMSRRVDPLRVKGSYAGAMGMPQFMPSSFARFAVDFDGDGRLTLWDGAADSIGSIANYYKAYGWQAQQPVALPASVSGEGYRELLALGIKPQANAAQLRASGVVPGADVNDAELMALFALQMPDGPQYWLGLNNFYVITRYNRSINYAMSVYQLAREIRSLRETPAAR